MAKAELLFYMGDIMILCSHDVSFHSALLPVSPGFYHRPLFPSEKMCYTMLDNHRNKTGRNHGKAQQRTQLL